MKIKFTDVGRDKWNGEMEIPNTDNFDRILDMIEDFIKKRHLLTTKFPEASYIPETNQGFIYSGFRSVGKFEVVK